MNTAYILTGGNIGNRMANLRKAQRILENEIGQIKKSSSIYETGAWGNNDQPDFYNQVHIIKTKLAPAVLMQKIDRIIYMQKTFADKLKIFHQKNIIKNVRHLGTIVAFEVVTSETDGYLHNISNDFTKFCLRKGTYLRPLGNTVYVMPPYCIRKKELEKIFSVIEEFLKEKLNSTPARD